MNVFETDRQLSGLEQLRHLLDSGRQAPIGETLKFSLTEVQLGKVVFAGVPGVHVYNPIGVVHGGYAATLLDSACGCAVHSALTSTQRYTTLELKVAYHRALTAGTGPIRAEGKVISLGRRVAFAEAAITDAEGKLYATATSTLLVIESGNSEKQQTGDMT